MEEECHCTKHWTEAEGNPLKLGENGGNRDGKTSLEQMGNSENTPAEWDAGKKIKPSSPCQGPKKAQGKGNELKGQERSKGDVGVRTRIITVQGRVKTRPNKSNPEFLGNGKKLGNLHSPA